MSQSISWCFLKMSETYCSCTHIALFQTLVTCHTSSNTYEWALFFSWPPACKSWLLHFHINWAVITILATRIFMSHHNLDAENQKYLYSTTVEKTVVLHFQYLFPLLFVFSALLHCLNLLWMPSSRRRSPAMLKKKVSIPAVGLFTYFSHARKFKNKSYLCLMNLGFKIITHFIANSVSGSLAALLGHRLFS